MQGASRLVITNKPNGIIFTGTTTNLMRRTWEQSESVSSGLALKYHLGHLVYCEHPETLQAARQCELNIKHWSRAWNVRLILKFNPSWASLYDALL
jgi:putative endonuclease